MMTRMISGPEDVTGEDVAQASRRLDDLTGLADFGASLLGVLERRPDAAVIARLWRLVVECVGNPPSAQVCAASEAFEVLLFRAGFEDGICVLSPEQAVWWSA
jgi:hypothetical protein